jgi:predicted small secreted protein
MSFTSLLRRAFRLLLLLGVTSVVSLTGTGCRTANGFGQDMEKAGDAIQEGTR